MGEGIVMHAAQWQGNGCAFLQGIWIYPQELETWILDSSSHSAMAINLNPIFSFPEMCPNQPRVGKAEGIFHFSCWNCPIEQSK